MNKQSASFADPARVLRAQGVAQLLSIHPMTVWRWARRGRLPKPIKLGPHTTVWRVRDIEAWLAVKAQRHNEAEGA